MPYDDYITWMRLTHNGRRSRSDMSPREQEEYDTLKVTSLASMNADEAAEAKRAYEEATGRSPRASDE
jgi:hypothetical protein